MFEGSLRSNLLTSLPALALSALLIVLTTYMSPNFLSDSNLTNLSSRLLPIGLVALGEAMVLFAGRIEEASMAPLAPIAEIAVLLGILIYAYNVLTNLK